MGLTVLVTIVLASLLIGIAVQTVGRRSSAADALIVAASAAFGAYFASETFPGSTLFQAFSDFGPSVDGFLIVPGVAFGAILATITYLATRDVYTSAPGAI
jgi:hypothetical protein